VAQVPGGGEPIATVVKTGGGTIDAAGFAVSMDAAFSHDPALATTDGGLNFNDSGSPNTGTLTLTGAGTFNGGAKLTKGTVTVGAGQGGVAPAAVSAMGTTNAQVVIVDSSALLSLGQTVTASGVPAGTVIAGFTNFKIIPTSAYTGLELAAGAPVLPYGNIDLPTPAAGKVYVILSNSTTYTGTDTPTLTFGATSPIGTGPLTMNGGTFKANGVNDFTPTNTVLKLTNSSTIDLAGANTLKLADSSAIPWTSSKVLTVANPSGGAGHSGLIVGSSMYGLTYNQLTEITVGANSPGAIQLPTGEVVAGTPQYRLNVNQSVDGTNVADVAALESALTDLDKYKNVTMTTNTGWTTANEALYLTDANTSGATNNLDLQGLIVYLANGGNGASGAPGGGNLTAVPEPSTIVLLALGGLAVCGAGLRRRAK
jgi:hypothetical protein